MTRKVISILGSTLILLFAAANIQAADKACCSLEKAGKHIHSHAHNDYEHDRPLLDALDNKFYSVEADFWMMNGIIVVAHDKKEKASDYAGTLKELYLDPLQKLVDKKGSVHGDGIPFYLWLDIKDGGDEVRPVLHKLLKQYSMLSTFTDEKVERRPVTAILTGDAKSKSAYVDEYSKRWACRDSNYYDKKDPKADRKWRWYALKWSNYVKWYGKEPIRPEELKKWKTIVDDIHAKGRKVRFYAVPDNKMYWQKALEVGVDQINTDKLDKLNAYLKTVK